MDEGTKVSKEGNTNTGNIVTMIEKEMHDKPKSKTSESVQDTLGGGSKMAENVGEVEGVEKMTARSKEGEGKVECGVETINVDEDADEDLAMKSDARGGSKTIEVAKMSEKAKKADKVADKKSRFRLMTPGQHDFRKVSGPVRNVFLYEIFIAELYFVVQSLCEFEPNL
jgi:hypothetical protein